jgi:hypothetical protein
LLHNAVLTSAVTNHDDADITDLEAFRVSTNKENEKTGVKVTMLAFLIKAWVAALKKYPEFNSSLEGDCLVYKLAFTLDALNRPEQLKRPDSGYPLPVQSTPSVQLWTPPTRPEQTKRPESGRFDTGQSNSTVKFLDALLGRN